MKTTICLTELKQRGWTDSVIRQFGLEPIAWLPNPRCKRIGSEIKLYDFVLVQRLEQTMEFGMAMDRIAAKRIASKKAVAERALKNTPQPIVSTEPSCPKSEALW